MHTEKCTEMLRTCRSCLEKCIVRSSPRHLDCGGLSFFKVMELNSSFALGIPTDFVKRIQYGVCNCKDAILQGPSGHLWHVNLCCADKRASFTEGWESFVSDQFIEAGDILVFRHIDDVHFSVQVFEPSGCEKQSTFSFQNYTSCCFRERNLNLSTICNMKRCVHRQNSTTASVSLLIGNKPNRNGDTEVEDLKMGQDETALDFNMEFTNSSKMKAADIMTVPTRKPIVIENKASWYDKTHSTICASTDVAPIGEEKIWLPHPTLAGINSGQSSSLRNLAEFSVVLPESAVTKLYRLTFPRAFINRWMPRKKVQVTLLYGKEPKSWKVWFMTYPQWSGLLSGWKAFVLINGLQKADECVFKLVDEVAYIFKVHIIRRGVVTCAQKKKTYVVGTCAHKKKTSVVSPVDVTCIQGRKEKTKIEVIEID